MKKIIAMLLCLLMVLGMVACGSETAEIPAVTEQTETTETTETTEEVAEEDKPYAGQELTVWTSYVEGTPTYDVANEYIAKFEEMTGAKVNVSHYGTDLGTILPTALGAGEPIDVFPLGSQQQLAANFEYTLDITDKVIEAGVLDRAYPICMDIIKDQSPNDDEYHAVPTVSSFNAFWYNKAAFEKAGITENPRTIEEFEAVCDALKAAGYNPIAQDAGYIITIFGALCERYCSEEVVADLCMNGGFSENENFVAACAKVLEWVNKGYFDPNSPGEWPASQNKIGLTEENAMVMTGMWVSGEIEEMTGAQLEWGCFKFPELPGGPGTYGASVSCTCNCINANIDPAKVDLAWEYINYMTSGEANKAITDADVYLVDDSTQEALPRFADAKEIMLTTETNMNYAGGLHANADIKTSIADVIIGLYTGAYANAEEAAAAFDALV